VSVDLWRSARVMHNVVVIESVPLAASNKDVVGEALCAFAAGMYSSRVVVCGDERAK
jgi:hypothetical protein